MTPEQERFYLASQWQLMWWKFKRHRVAVVSGDRPAADLRLDAGQRVPGALQPAHAQHRLHLRAAAARAPVPRRAASSGRSSTARQDARHGDAAARLHAKTRRGRSRSASSAAATPTSSGGLIEATFHLVCPAEGGTLFLLGTDRLGRDVLSRIIYGARISLTIGLLGIAISFVLGIVIGGLAGYYGGWVDMMVQRDHRGHPLVSRAAAVDGAVGDPAGDLEPDPDLFRHHGDPRRCSTGPASRAPCARSCWRCARRITARPRG